jgi:hypothetical protein
MQKKSKIYRNAKTGRFENFKKARQYGHIIYQTEKGKKVSAAFKPVKRPSNYIELRDLETGRILKPDQIRDKKVVITIKKGKKIYRSKTFKLDKKSSELLYKWVKNQKFSIKKLNEKKKKQKPKKYPKIDFKLEQDEIDGLNHLFELIEEHGAYGGSLVSNTVEYFCNVSDLNKNMNKRALDRFKLYCFNEIEGYRKNRLGELDYTYFYKLYEEFSK